MKIDSKIIKEYSLGVMLANAIIAILLVPFCLAYMGLLISYLWEWYVHPITNLPKITIYQGTGIYLIWVFMLTFIQKKETKLAALKDISEGNDIMFGWLRLYSIYMSYTIAFGIAWAWHSLKLFNW